MNRRNLTTASFAFGAMLLLVSGVAFARETERGDDRGAHSAATPVPTAADAVQRQPSASSQPSPTASLEDKGGDRPASASDDGATPTGSPDDRGGDRTDGRTAKPAASPDDHGGDRPAGVSDDASTPTASPDDKGGDDATATPTATPTASPDDHGGHGWDD